MRFFPPPIEIGDLDGFSKSDIFKRSVLADGLTKLLSECPDPLVVALDAPWGAGKTVFLKMWAGELRKKGYPVIYFDAFENDYIEDCFVALASQVVSISAELDEEKGKIYLQSARKVAGIVARSALKIGVKLASAGALDALDFGEGINDVSNEASATFDKYLGEGLTKQKERRATIEGFKKALSLVAASKARDAGCNSRPLIFIVDELDRCRPDFSLELLERVKHFFSVKNVHFVLGVNQDQLRSAVAAAYGPQVDAYMYLQKFVHFSVSLGNDVGHYYRKDANVYLDYIIDKMEVARDPYDNFLSQFVAFLKRQLRQIPASLRNLERMICLVSIVAKFTPDRLRQPHLIGVLCILKTVCPEMFAEAKTGQLTTAQLSAVLQLDPAEELWWSYLLGQPLEEEQKKMLDGELAHMDIRPNEGLKFLIGLVEGVRIR